MNVEKLIKELDVLRKTPRAAVSGSCTLSKAKLEEIIRTLRRQNAEIDKLKKDARPEISAQVDAEGEDKLIKLPVEPGTPIFAVMSFEEGKKEVVAGKVVSVSFEHTKEATLSVWIYCTFECGLNYWYPARSFTKNVYFSEEAALEVANKKGEENEKI